MNLSLADLERFATEFDATLSISEWAQKAIERSHQRLQSLMAKGVPLYGSATGFGPLVVHSSGGCESVEHAMGLLDHLGAGYGEPAPAEVVRATMMIRLLTVCRGYSGIRPVVAAAYARFFNTGAIPVVPSMGSLGASGDLIPLAHITRCLGKEGKLMLDGQHWTSKHFWDRYGPMPDALQPRDALGLVNGTSFSTAWASLGLTRAWRLLSFCEELTASIYRILGCRQQAISGVLNRVRGQSGQMASARAIRKYLSELGGAVEDSERPLQEIYSIRCAPQVIGACRQQLVYASELLEAEINGVDDNPVIAGSEDGGEEGQAFHGGNFHAQPVAFAADAVNAALTQLGILVDRQIDFMVNPACNGGCPRLLAVNPGPQSGLAGGQITASSLVSEMRGRCQAHATSSVPTNGGNQDIVPMSATAARASWDQTSLLAGILAVGAITVRQLAFFKEDHSLEERDRLFDGRPRFHPLDKDRPLLSEIQGWSQYFLNAPALENF